MVTIFEYLILIFCAIFPAIALLFITWFLDRIEKESKLLICLLFFLGSLSCFPIGFAEIFLGFFNLFPEESPIFIFIENFAIVAVCEEFGKFAILFLVTWWNKGFNYKYDALIYAVAVSLGFATLENVMYVVTSQLSDGAGFSTVIARTLFAIPGHFSDSVFMGFCYGFAKMFANKKQHTKCVLFLFAANFIPMCLHGFYDFTLSLQNILFFVLFLAFIVVVDIATLVLVIYTMKTDFRISKEPIHSAFFNPRPQYNIPNNQYYNNQNNNQYYNNQNMQNNKRKY